MRIESGRAYASKDDDGWDLHEGSGLRTHTQRVTFREPFDERPEVQIGLAKIEIPAGAPVAIDVDVKAVDTAGFEVEYLTGDDGRLDEVAVAWIAIDAG